MSKQKRASPPPRIGPVHEGSNVFRLLELLAKVVARQLQDSEAPKNNPQEPSIDSKEKSVT